MGQHSVAPGIRQREGEHFAQATTEDLIDAVLEQAAG
jgi:hypothetical protein